MIDVIAEQEVVTAGKGFDLTIRRIWSKDLAPLEIGEDVLPPLHLLHQETIRRENDTHVEETRRYLAYAFTPGDLTVAAPSLSASPVLGGTDLKVRGNSLDLIVKGAIDLEAPGPAEMPDGPIKRNRTWLYILIVMLMVMLIPIIRRTRRRTEPVSPQPESASPPLDVKVLEELRRLRAFHPSNRAETQSLYLELTAILRRYLGDRFSFDVRERTTEELLGVADLRAYESLLRSVFGHADLVKFARHDPTGVEREQMMDSAESLVKETSAP